jgi:hypothetical protein
MTDRTTKTLLAVIALGLWANLAVSLFRPTVAVAAKGSNIESDVSSIESAVSSIANGTCTNSKMC